MHLKYFPHTVTGIDTTAFRHNDGPNQKQINFTDKIKDETIFVGLGFEYPDVFIKHRQKYVDFFNKIKDAKTLVMIFKEGYCHHTCYVDESPTVMGVKRSWYVELMKMLEEADVPFDKVHFALSDHEIEKYTQEFKLPFRFHRYNSEITNRLNRLEEYQTVIDPEEVIKNKTNNFTFLVRQKRLHRISLLALLHSENLLDKMFWTFQAGLSTGQINKWRHSDFSGTYVDKFDCDLDEVCKLVPKHFDGTHTANQWLINQSKEYLLRASTRFDVVTETCFDKNLNPGDQTLFVTEKSTQCLAFGQLPFIFATQNHMRCLVEEYGFKFDDKFLKVDAIDDGFTRMKAMVDLIKQANADPETFYQKHLKDIEYNAKNVFDLMKGKAKKDERELAKIVDLSREI
jgi:hypothetical protein